MNGLDIETLVRHLKAIVRGLEGVISVIEKSQK